MHFVLFIRKVVITLLINFSLSFLKLEIEVKTHKKKVEQHEESEADRASSLEFLWVLMCVCWLLELSRFYCLFPILLDVDVPYLD